MPNPPTTFDELTAICDSLETISNCLGIPGGAEDVNNAAYYNYPFVSLLGGYIFAFTANRPDATDVGLDSSEAIAGALPWRTGCWEERRQRHRPKGRLSSSRLLTILPRRPVVP